MGEIRLKYGHLTEIWVLKYGHLMPPSWRFSDKVTPHIDFTDEAVAESDVPVIKILCRCW